MLAYSKHRKHSNYSEHFLAMVDLYMLPIFLLLTREKLLNILTKINKIVYRLHIPSKAES
uniref:Uncharacterized protein n=1 Tax=Oryza brachyantha TaxID=4533 RepID=J3LPF8_ORYBR